MIIEPAPATTHPATGLRQWAAGSSPAVLRGADGGDPRAGMGARDHRASAGGLDRQLLSVAERYLRSRGPAVAVDFREWASVWSEVVAADAAGRPASPAPTGR